VGVSGGMLRNLHQASPSTGRLRLADHEHDFSEAFDSTTLKCGDNNARASSTVAKSVSPSTGEVLGQSSAGGRVEAAAAITTARKAFDASVWSLEPQLRSRALLELADRLDERADAIAPTISREIFFVFLLFGLVTTFSE
jgi:hypothetical protein